MAGSYRANGCGIEHEKEAMSAVICSDSSQYEGTFCVLQLGGLFPHPQDCLPVSGWTWSRRPRSEGFPVGM